jgi:hypothetical protein
MYTIEIKHASWMEQLTKSYNEQEYTSCFGLKHNLDCKQIHSELFISIVNRYTLNCLFRL